MKKAFLSAEQSADVSLIVGNLKGGGLLDFVAMWYLVAVRYIRRTAVECAFVSTNSITQGEQATTLWKPLLFDDLKINFAHRTFAWESEARGKAHVHVVIVGFAMADRPSKTVTEYESDGDGTASAAKNISPYLTDGPSVVIESRSAALCNVPPIVFGSMPNDGGHLLLSATDRAELLRDEPGAAAYLRPTLGSHEFINGEERWCLWLADAEPSAVRRMPKVLERVEAVRKMRLASTRETTRGLAETPMLFGEIRQPTSEYLLIPSVSSERRPYIPMGFLSPTVVATNLALVIADAIHWHLVVLSSTMHMAWVRKVCGRLKSDYRYSNKLVYNNFPWPTEATEKQRQAVERAAAGVLAARAGFPGQTLADLYDPLAMPKPLRDAHRLLDAAVDKCYRPARFESDRHRVEYLFQLYEKLTSLFVPIKKSRRRKAD